MEAGSDDYCEISVACMPYVEQDTLLMDQSGIRLGRVGFAWLKQLVVRACLLPIVYNEPLVGWYKDEHEVPLCRMDAGWAVPGLQQKPVKSRGMRQHLGW